MIDEPDDVLDYNVAQHIVKVHQLKEEAISPEFSTVQLQRYIAYARTLKPQVCWWYILALFSQMWTPNPYRTFLISSLLLV